MPAPAAWFPLFLPPPLPFTVSLSNHLPPPPFMPSPSPGPGQALSNRVRPPHRPVFHHPVPPLRSSRACRRACPELVEEPVPSPVEEPVPSPVEEPVLSPVEEPVLSPAEGSAPPPSPAPKLRQPAPQKIRQISRPLARLPLWGSRASGREYPKNPHRNHRRLPLPCRSKTCPGRDPGPALSLAPACTPTAPHPSIRRLQQESSLRPPTPCSTRQKAPRAASRVFWKKLLRAQDHPKTTPPHPTDPGPRLSASAPKT